MLRASLTRQLLRAFPFSTLEVLQASRLKSQVPWPQCHFLLGRSGDNLDRSLPSNTIFINLFIYLFLAVLGLRFYARAFLQLRRAGAALHRGARASHYRGLSCCGAQAPDAQAQQLWLTGPVAPRHMGSSQTRARTRVPRIGRQTPNQCTTREAPNTIFIFELTKVLFAFNTLSLHMYRPCIFSL